MKHNEIIDNFLNRILEQKEKLIFGPSDLVKDTEIHFNTAKNFIEDFTIFSKAIDKLRDEGVILIGGKTPKGTPRLMIVPTEEKMKEVEELEITLGIDDKLETTKLEIELEPLKINKDILHYKYPDQWFSRALFDFITEREKEHEAIHFFQRTSPDLREEVSEKFKKEIIVGEPYGR